VNHPSKATVRVGLNGGAKKSVKVIKAATLGNNSYRPDLARAALARYTQLARSLRVKSTGTVTAKKAGQRR
jgi:hypothetical protein